MTRVRLVLALGLLLLLTIPILGLPVTISRTGGSERPPVWDRTGRAIDTRVEVVNSGPGGIVVTAPSLTFPEVFDPTHQISSMQGFSVDPASGALQADAGGILVIEGVFGDLELTVERRDESGEIRITRETPLGTQEWISPAEASTGWERLQLPSPSSTLVSQRLFLARSFSVPDGSTVSIGPRRVAVDAGRVSVAALAITGVAAVLQGWLLIAAAVLTLGICWGVGRLLLRRDDPPHAVALTFGLCLLAIVINSLAYWLPLRWVVPLVVLATGSVGLLAIGPPAASLRASFLRELVSLGRRVGLVLVPALLLFWPIFSWGPWFAGGYKTDLYEYASLASLLPDHSLLSLRSLNEAQASGNITSGAGVVWRSIDSVTASFVSQVFGLPSLGGFVVVGVFVFLVFGVSALAFADSRGRPVLFLALVALLSPVLTALFLENYFSQYYFVALVPSFVLVLSWVWTRERTTSAQTWALASGAAVMIAVYPYFFGLVGAACATVLVFTSGVLATVRRLALPVLIKTVVLTNLALLPVLNYGKTVQFNAGLDGIARDWLIGPWASTEVTQMLLGVRSYHWRQPVESVDGLGTSVQAMLRVAELAVAPSIWAAAIVAAIVVLAVILGLRSPVRTLESRLIVGVVAAFVAFGLVYAILDRPYVMLKSLWVAAALVPVLIATVSVPRRVMAIPLVASAALAVVWATTSMADRIAWLLPLNGSEDRALHVSVIPDLHQLSLELDDGDANPALMTRGAQPLAGSDRDRVLAAFTVVLFRDAEIDCLTCEGTKIPEALTCPTDEVASAATVGADARPEVCQLERRFEGSFQDIYSARGPQ